MLHAFKHIRHFKRRILVKNLIGLSLVAVILFTAAFACNMGTTGISSFKVSKDKEGSQESSSFKGGDTLYGRAAVTTASGAIKVKFRIETDDVAGASKGTTVPGSDVTVDLAGDGTATYTVPIPEGAVKGGKYNVIADLMDDKGDKKDSKTSGITIAMDSSTSQNKTSGNKTKTELSASDDDKRAGVTAGLFYCMLDKLADRFNIHSECFYLIVELNISPSEFSDFFDGSTLDKVLVRKLAVNPGLLSR